MTNFLLYGLCAFFVFFLLDCDKSSSISDPPPMDQQDTVALINEILAGPDVCGSCHTQHYQEWSTSMHAYAMQDPVFVALNEMVQQNSPDVPEQFCVKCHSPLGTLLGETAPGYQAGQLSSLSAHAIHCDVCHTMNLDKISSGESAHHFNLDGSRQGPIEDPLENGFHKSVYRHEYNNSTVCSSCHDVKSPDGTFFIEATSMEWDESPYAAMGVECQDCHMPAYEGSTVAGAPQRTLHRHYFNGVDYPLTDFPGKTETIERVRQLLNNAISLSVVAPDSVKAYENFDITVNIKNDKTGHDIPSGNIFDRQMWLEVVLQSINSGQIYFSSGLTDDYGDLKDLNSTLVQSGMADVDTFLTLFNGIAYQSDHKKTPFFWQAASFDKNTIPAFKSYNAQYKITAPASETSMQLSVKLKFRSFPPYLLREIGLAHLRQELIIFTMAEFEKEINVQTFSVQ
jgi:Cytochrome c554 and c-prime